MMEEFTKGAREAILDEIAGDAGMAATIMAEDEGGTEEQMNQAFDDAYISTYDTLCDSTDEELNNRYQEFVADKAGDDAAAAATLVLLDPTTMSRL